MSLLHGDSVTAVIREGVIYDDIGENPDALYTMLLTTGYLTAIHKQSTFGGQLCRLVIPNREVKDAYRVEVLERMRGRLAASSLLLMMEDLVAGHVVPFSKTLERYIAYLVSSYDAANKESFYHGFLLGMTALFVSEYVIESNRESGYGRFDIAIFPKDTSKAGVLMEFKAADSESQLEDKADEALRQIEEKQYVTEFEKRGILKVWKYGIAFCGKQVHVKMKI
ncbi:PD-(D/E)XK nuclease domain-containing protein [Megasphaera butyrica]|uniref:PD-(D/E)XK nuclease domain-containing protein n=1 Tax=Megasphaera butyrica TaxID=2981791 RepID=UPI002265E848|nr:PD-(D/E)XK nuclease domain-containing protein [Megasphaera butyrica]MCU6713848.1 PD-(D/E)XK nuclease domain-containing protein [Megasphaera butyrica]